MRSDRGVAGAAGLLTAAGLALAILCVAAAAQPAASGGEEYAALPYYSEEELRVLTDASRQGRSADALAARRDFQTWARSTREFLDLAGGLQSESATRLAVAYGTKATADLVAAVTDPPDYEGTTVVMEELGDRLSRRWFPRETFEERLRAVVGMFHQARTDLARGLVENATPTAQLDSAMQFAERCRALRVPPERIRQNLKLELEGIVDLIIETRDFTAARFVLSDPDLKSLADRSQERELRRILDRG